MVSDTRHQGFFCVSYGQTSVSYLWWSLWSTMYLLHKEDQPWKIVFQGKDLGFPNVLQLKKSWFASPGCNACLCPTLCVNDTEVCHWGCCTSSTSCVHFGDHTLSSMDIQRLTRSTIITGPSDSDQDLAEYLQASLLRRDCHVGKSLIAAVVRDSSFGFAFHWMSLKESLKRCTSSWKCDERTNEHNWSGLWHMAESQKRQAFSGNRQASQDIMVRPCLLSRCAAKNHTSGYSRCQLSRRKIA